MNGWQPSAGNETGRMFRKETLGDLCKGCLWEESCAMCVDENFNANSMMKKCDDYYGVGSVDEKQYVSDLIDRQTYYDRFVKDTLRSGDEYKYTACHIPCGNHP